MVKTLHKFFFSGTEEQGVDYDNVIINHEPMMTLTYFRAMSTKVVCALEWGKLVICMGTLAGNWQMDIILIILEQMIPGLHLYLHWGYIPKYSNMLVGKYSISQASLYRTSGFSKRLKFFVRIFNMSLKCLQNIE